MPRRSSQCLILSAAFLASTCAAQPGAGGAVSVETELARKMEFLARKMQEIAQRGDALAHRPERRSGDRIWTGVIFATNPDVPKPVPKELGEYEASLKRVFGYNQFKIIGTAVEPINEEGESWLLPIHSFSLSVRARRAPFRETRGGYLLNLQLFQERRPIVNAEVRLAPGNPLFIRGPQCGKGQIIIILKVQHKPPSESPPF